MQINKNTYIWSPKDVYKNIYYNKITKIGNNSNIQQYILAYSQNGILVYNENL